MIQESFSLKRDPLIICVIEFTQLGMLNGLPFIHQVYITHRSPCSSSSLVYSKARLLLVADELVYDLAKVSLAVGKMHIHQ